MKIKPWSEIEDFEKEKITDVDSQNVDKDKKEVNFEPIIN